MYINVTASKLLIENIFKILANIVSYGILQINEAGARIFIDELNFTDNEEIPTQTVF